MIPFDSKRRPWKKNADGLGPRYVWAGWEIYRTTNAGWIVRMPSGMVWSTRLRNRQDAEIEVENGVLYLKRQVPR